LECLNECISYADDCFPDIYFRRSQALTYNKYTEIDKLYIALGDVRRAILMRQDLIYIEHEKILVSLIEESKRNENEMNKSIIY
jgi:hypothetical protein